jgi:hypothetical protein
MLVGGSVKLDVRATGCEGVNCAGLLRVVSKKGLCGHSHEHRTWTIKVRLFHVTKLAEILEIGSACHRTFLGATNYNNNNNNNSKLLIACIIVGEEVI